MQKTIETYTVSKSRCKHTLKQLNIVPQERS